MTYIACEMALIQSLLCEMGVASSQPILMFCDNDAAMYIANNLVFHERMKHIEVDCYFIRDMIMAKRIVTSFPGHNLVIFLLSLCFTSFFLTLCDKLGMIDIYAPA